MGMDLGSKGSFKSDINVTPLVDVMLVLLIIMMLIAPLLNSTVPLTLPEADHTGDKPDTQNQTVVAIDSLSRCYVNSIPATADDLAPRVRRALEGTRDKLVYVKGDKDAKYAAVMDAMDALRRAQIDNVALITERKADQGGSAAGRRR